MKFVRCSIAIILLTFGLIASTFAGEKELRVNVTNPSSFARTSETISLSWKSLSKKLPSLKAESATVSDAKAGEELVSQLCEGEFLFQSSFKANETRAFIIKNGKQKTNLPQSLVDGRFVEPRQDYAWENDRIAFRMYGPALAKEVNNGIDVWCKRVRHLIAEKWYKGEADTGAAKKSYHVDRGEGADFFSVGKTLGAGSCGIWYNEKVHQPGVFSSYLTIANGPIRLIFELTYDSLTVEGKRFKEVKRITIDAGKNLNKIEATYTSEQSSHAIQVAVGLVKRKDVAFAKNESSRWMSLWGATNADSINGLLGTGIVLTTAFDKILEEKEQYLAISNATTSKPFTYYAGAGWTRSGDFSNEQEWKDYLATFARNLTEPLKIRFVK